MYNVLVAEDSKPIMRDIVRLLHESNFELDIREAYDGESALEILESFQPDIIFTDIKMPITNGLSLIQKVKSIYPHTKSVIISGYADFQFTHQALMLQVDDYIMKPVDETDFKKIFLRLTEEIDLLKVQYQEIMLQKCIEEDFTLPLGILPEKYMIAIVSVGLMLQYAPPLSKKILYENLKYERNGNNYWLVNTKLHNEKVIIYNLSHASSQKILLVSELLLESLKTKYARINIICSGIITDAAQLNATYIKMRNYLGKNKRFDECRMYELPTVPDDRKLYLEQREALELFRKKITRIFNSRSATDYCQEIQKQIQEWKKNAYTVNGLRKFLLILLEELFLTVNGSLEFMEEPGILADKILNEHHNYEELGECLQEYAVYLGGIKDEKMRGSVELVQEITSYMRANVYHNVSLQDMAEHFDISSSYICRIFKIYYGDTPISYYNRIKIEEAKKILEEYRNMKVKDIAEMLGFNDQYYFSKVFKQQYGVNPSVYKNQLENGFE